MSPERGHPEAVAAADPMRLDITGPSPRTGTGASGVTMCHLQDLCPAILYLTSLSEMYVHNKENSITLVALKKQQQLYVL